MGDRAALPGASREYQDRQWHLLQQLLLEPSNPNSGDGSSRDAEAGVIARAGSSGSRSAGHSATESPLPAEHPAAGTSQNSGGPQQSGSNVSSQSHIMGLSLSSDTLKSIKNDLLIQGKALYPVVRFLVEGYFVDEPEELEGIGFREIGLWDWDQNGRLIRCPECCITSEQAQPVTEHPILRFDENHREQLINSFQDVDPMNFYTTSRSESNVFRRHMQLKIDNISISTFTLILSQSPPAEYDAASGTSWFRRVLLNFGANSSAEPKTYEIAIFLNSYLRGESGFCWVQPDPSHSYHYPFHFKGFRLEYRDSERTYHGMELGRLRSAGSFLTTKSQYRVIESHWAIHIYSDTPNINATTWTCLVCSDESPTCADTSYGLLKHGHSDRSTLLGHFVAQVARAISTSSEQWTEVLGELDAQVYSPNSQIYNEDYRNALLFDDDEFTRSKAYYGALQYLRIFTETINSTVESLDSMQTAEHWGLTQTPEVLGSARGIFRGPRDQLASHLKRIQAKSRTVESLRDGIFNASAVFEARVASKQADTALKQNRSVYLLTTVTVIFLPLSFATSVFGIESILPASTDMSVFLSTLVSVSIATYVVAYNLSTLLRKSQDLWVYAVAKFRQSTKKLKRAKEPSGDVELQEV